MALFKQKQKGPSYHIPSYRSEWHILRSTTEDLERWASDPNCIEKDQCAAVLAERLAQEEALRRERLRNALAFKRTRLTRVTKFRRTHATSQDRSSKSCGYCHSFSASLRNLEVRQVNRGCIAFPAGSEFGVLPIRGLKARKSGASTPPQDRFAGQKWCCLRCLLH